ncbi:MAG: diguanylate cyclase [Acidobacteria bacterium]|nr:diguanylate cyclase [Acidobacteriota bacterium]
MTKRPFAARACAGGALAAAGAAVVASVLSASAVWLVIWTAAALLLAYLACLQRVADERRNARQMAELNLATIEALALAIDAKDETSPNHIRRVQAYATGLARALGMSEAEVQAIRTATLLHDIGKLAIPDHILAKPGPLTPEEFQKVRVHPEVGAEILRSVPFPYPVTSIILSHHERWDGRGYPTGLKEHDIPLGARVICLADYFEALTSDRPYHRAIGQEAAAEVLRQEAGKALDPRLVDLFLTVLPTLAAEIEMINSPVAKATPQPQTGEGRRTLGARPASSPSSTVFENIAVAHREIHALYQVAQTMGTKLTVDDTMTLISSKLSSLVPFSACALFLYSPSREHLQCRFATGADSELIQQLTLRSGQGLTGWVARNRRPLVNARPGTDLEAMGSKAPTVLQSALVCPLVFNDRLIGTLGVYHTAPGFYHEDHARLLDRVCEQAAAVINNAIVFEQTQEDSLTDPLTGLPNTRSLFQHLARELARAERHKSEVSLLVMDLDEFKDINDTFGHRVGDWALRETARVLRGAIRPYDMCVRYAGDEFIVVLSDCGRSEAEAKRLELQTAIGQIALDVEGRRVPLSISAGMAVFPHDGDNYDQLAAKADRQMYQDKSRRKSEASRRLTSGTPPLARDTPLFS